MEIWKQLENYDKYEVSSFGRVRRSDKILKPHSDLNGYLSIMLCKEGIPRRFRIHNLVANTFLEQKEGCVVDHINCIRSDNRVENLRFITQSENIYRKENTNQMRNIRKHGKKFQVRFGRDTIVQTFDTLEDAIHFRNQTLKALLV